MITQPHALKRSLLPHQLRSVHEMEKREECSAIRLKNFCIHSNIGIYADIVGYGKTLAVIALLLRDRMPFDNDLPYMNEIITQIYGQGCIIKKQILQYQKINCNLIVVSQSIIKQWLQEFSYTDLRVTVVNNRKRCELLDPHLYDAVLCSPTMYNHLISRFPNCAWKRFVFDEPTHIRISGMQKIVAGFHWLITATPDMLLYTNNYRNPCHYLGSLFGSHFDYNVFKQLIFKNDDDFVRASFELPPLTHRYHQCFTTITSLLKNIISEHVSEMISAGNIEGAVKSLGGTSSNNIIDLIRSEKMEFIREAELKIQRYSRLQDHTRVQKWEAKRKEMKDDLHQLEDRIHVVFRTNQCNICLGVQHKTVMLRCCYNMYCGYCILKWFEKKDTCPLCRNQIDASFLIYIQDCLPSSTVVVSPESSSGTIQESSAVLSPQPLPDGVQSGVTTQRSKMDVIRDLYHNKQGAKFIIFSDYDETLKLLQQYFEFPILEVKGKMETRNKVLDTFKNSDHGQILFLNSLDNGAGLNLQEATDVILFHSMTETTQTQIIGRCHRMGREHELVVHHLLS